MENEFSRARWLIARADTTMHELDDVLEWSREILKQTGRTHVWLDDVLSLCTKPLICGFRLPSQAPIHSSTSLIGRTDFVLHGPYTDLNFRLT